MKTLGKFKINPQKIINNEELVNLRGGSYEHWVSCRIGDDICWSGPVWDCETDARASCFVYCPEYTSYVCV